MDMAANESERGGRREHWSGVVGVSLGLVLLVGLVLTVQLQRAGAVDGSRLLSEWFEVGELPYGLVVDDAARLPDELPGRELFAGRRRVVRLVRADAPEEAPRKEPARREDGELERVDWARIESGPADQPPIEVLVIQYPGHEASSQLRRLFLSDSDKDKKDDGIGPEGGRVTLDRDRVRWGAFEARSVHERKLEEGGTFRDTMRVNLAMGDRAIVMFARWSRGQPASRPHLEELLESLQARDS